MTKKRMALVAVLPLTIAVILGVLALLPPRPGVTKANFDRIEMGMKKAEVERFFAKSGKRLPVLWGTKWTGDEGEAIIRFDYDEKVIDKIWSDGVDQPSALTLAKIMQWLHLD